MATVPKCCEHVYALIDLLEEFDRTHDLNLLSGFKYPKLLRTVLKYTYCPGIRFNFSSTNIHGFEVNTKAKRGADARLKQFLGLLKANDLNSRPRELIIKEAGEVLSKTGPKEFELYSRVLDQDLLVGLTPKLVNSVFPELIVYPPLWMEPCEYNGHHIKYPCSGEPKLPGVKLKLLVSAEDATAYSTDYCVFNYLFKQVLSKLKKYCERKHSTLALDVLVYSSSYSETLQHLYDCVDGLRFKPEHIQALGFHCFDLVENGDFTATYRNRRARLVKLVSGLKGKTDVPLTVMPSTAICSDNDLKPFKTLDKEYPLIVKDYSSTYTAGYSEDWLTINPKNYCVRILDIALDRLKGCTALIVDLHGVHVEISDLYDSQRELLAKTGKKLVNTYCEITKLNSHYKFVQLRTDKGKGRN